MIGIAIVGGDITPHMYSRPILDDEKNEISAIILNSEAVDC